QSKREAAGKSRAGFLPALDFGYSYGVHEEENSPTGRELSTVTLVATYNLFNGKSDEKNFLRAKALAEAEEGRRESAEADTVLAVKEAFIDVLRAGKFLETSKESVRLLTRQQQDASLHLREGLIARNDFLRVAVDLSTTQQELLQNEGNLTISRKKLEKAMGVEIATGEEIEDFKDLPEAGDLPFADMQAKMLENRSELKYLKHVKEAHEFHKEAIAGGRLPRVNLTLAHERYGDSSLPSGRDNSYDDDTKAAIEVSWNLFDGYYKRFAIAEVNAIVKAAGEEARETEAALTLQLNTVLEEHRVARGKLVAAEVAVSQAEENYRVTDNRLKQREATIVDILDARFYLTRARNQRAMAFYEIYKSAARIDRVLEQ
ncbi:MAG: TolC family protein, partial [Desulfobacterales bacterium]|nr:TolC family protein [Desulfobacterales bacterium]